MKINQFITIVFGLVIASVCLGNVDAAETKKGVLHVDAVEASELLDQDASVQVLDVRTAEEFSEGQIKGAINIDYYADDFAEQVAKLDPNTTYLVHCRSGGRSGRSLSILKSAGIKNLIHLDGGYRAWLAAMPKATGQ